MDFLATALLRFSLAKVWVVLEVRRDLVLGGRLDNQHLILPVHRKRQRVALVQPRRRHERVGEANNLPTPRPRSVVTQRVRLVKGTRARVGVVGARAHLLKLAPAGKVAEQDGLLILHTLALALRQAGKAGAHPRAHAHTNGVTRTHARWRRLAAGPPRSRARRASNAPPTAPVGHARSQAPQAGWRWTGGGHVEPKTRGSGGMERASAATVSTHSHMA